MSETIDNDNSVKGDHLDVKNDDLHFETNIVNQESEAEDDEEEKHVESKEDMFVDAADDIEEDALSQDMDTFNNSNDDDHGKLTLSKEFKEENEDFTMEVSSLLHQLKELVGGGDGGSNGVSLSEMISECSKCVKVCLEQKLESENMIRELQQQMEELNLKVQVEQNVDIVADRMLGMLSMAINQEELLDYSVLGKVSHVERSTSLLVEQYRWFRYEVDQLIQFLLEGGFNVGPPEEFGYASVFTVTRSELMELKKMEGELLGKVSYLEDANRKLVEDVEKEKASAESLYSEFEKVKVELEQEKTRCANAKEKLGMAVTKGKALVQQRDSLKMSLAEKTSELEKCLAELQEKSSAAEAAELWRGELTKCENLVASLQKSLNQRNAVLETCEEVISQTNVPEELQSVDVAEKLKWIVHQVTSLQETVSQNNLTFQTFEDIFSQIAVADEMESMDMVERLKRLVNLVSSLQEMISQRNKILISLEEIFSEVNVPAELQSMDAVQRFRWIVEERNALKSNLLEFHRLKDALSLIDLPETASSSDLETRIGWLKDSVKQAKDEIVLLQDQIVRTKENAKKEIDRLSGNLLTELQEKEYVKMELNELTSKYEGISQEAHQALSEKDQMVRLLLEGSGMEEKYSDVTTLIQRCLEKLKEHSSASSFDNSSVDLEVFQRMQSLLFVKDQELVLCQDLLEEDFLVRSEVSNLSNDLRMASAELAALKEEKDSLLKDLERSEEKSALLKEKLSLAVKKGKGLFQDREKFKLELQQKESEVSECRDQINKLSAELQQIAKLEADLVDMKNQRDQLEQFLLESNNMLQRVIESVDRIILPADSAFEEPIEKVNWLAGYMDECQKAKSSVEHELLRVKEETGILASKLSEAQECVKSLEDALSTAESQIYQLTEEKQVIEAAKENVEQDLKKAKEEADAQRTNFNEACAIRKSLEDALSLAENNISLIVKEREEAQLSRAAMETELAKVREEVDFQTEKLTEAYKSIKSLEDSLTQAEINVSLLSEQNSQLQIGISGLENELKKLKEEAESHSSRLEDTTVTMRSLEDVELSRAALESELVKVREEVSVQTEKLLEAQTTIKSLEESLSEAEANISLLSEQNSHFQVERTNLKNELKKLQEEAELHASTAVKQLEDAHLSTAALETELEKVKEEVAFQTEKLTEAYGTIKSLEDSLSQAEASVSMVSEQNNRLQEGRTELENELQNLKGEAESQTSRLADISAIMKSLEDALSKAGNDIHVLEGEKRSAEEEICTLNSKLKVCMDELAGTSGSIENSSAEFIHHFGDLQMIMKNENPLAMVRQHFEKEFEKFKNMDLILSEIKDCFVDRTSKTVPSYPLMADDLCLTNPFPHQFGSGMNFEMDDSNFGVAGIDDISKLFKKTIEGLQLQNTNLEENFKGFSTFIFEFIDALSIKLRATKDAVADIFEHMELMNQKMKYLEINKGEQDKTISMLEKDCRVLLFACNEASSRLRFEVKNHLLDLSSVPELLKLKHDVPEVTEGDAVGREHDSRYDNMAENLLLASGKVHDLMKLFESTSNVAAFTIEDLQKELRESRAAYENAAEERDILQNRVFELEAKIEALKNSCKELELKTEDYQAMVEKLKEKEDLMLRNFSMKEQEAEDQLLSTSELRTLFDKIREVEIFSLESEVGDTETYNSVDVNKLFYIVDSVPNLHHQINTLSHDKEKLQSTLSMQVLEIEHLKKEIEILIRNNQESEKMKAEMSEITLALEKIMAAVGGNEIVGDQISPVSQKLLPLLEKQVMTLIWEVKTSESQAQELGSRLLGSQKIIDELSAKVKLLEDSFESKTVPPEVVQERSIFEAPPLPSGSEISEIEDVGSVGKNTVSPVPSAAQLRTMRKGSTDHLVLNVESESSSLINHEETDEDKGHVFKSLNTSGLIPKQGKSLADRVDGIWVSGGRVLMSRPRARLGLIAYWLFLHLWLIGTIL